MTHDWLEIEDKGNAIWNSESFLSGFDWQTSTGEAIDDDLKQTLKILESFRAQDLVEQPETVVKHLSALQFARQKRLSAENKKECIDWTTLSCDLRSSISNVLDKHLKALSLKEASPAGNLKTGTWNLQNYTAGKAAYFDPSHAQEERITSQVLKLAHLWAVQEVTAEGIYRAAKLADRSLVVAPGNSRDQHNAIVFDHKRLSCLETIVLQEMAFDLSEGLNSPLLGIVDLRPGLLCRFKDLHTQEEFYFLCLHLKSMLGGEAQTSLVRNKQLQALIPRLKFLIESGYKVKIAGDFNTKILFRSGYTDLRPLYCLKILSATYTDRRPTHAWGHKIDDILLSYKADVVKVHHLELFTNPLKTCVRPQDSNSPFEYLQIAQNRLAEINTIYRNGIDFAAMLEPIIQAAATLTAYKSSSSQSDTKLAFDHVPVIIEESRHAS